MLVYLEITPLQLFISSSYHCYNITFTSHGHNDLQQQNEKGYCRSKTEKRVSKLQILVSGVGNTKVISTPETALRDSNPVPFRCQSTYHALPDYCIIIVANDYHTRPAPKSVRDTIMIFVVRLNGLYMH